MAENIGMMSGAYFASKGDLLKWLNDFFKIGYTKVEQVASGAIHCQILDSIFPGKVPLHQVNFAAKHDYEFVKNYKILQKVFDKQNIKRHIDVEKLIRAKYQDNLEFLQWIKHLWDVRYGGQDYDAVARREEALSRFNKGRRHPVKSGAARAIRAPKSTTEKKEPAAAPAAKSGVRAARGGRASGRGAPAAVGRARPTSGKARSGGSSGDLDAKVEELTNKLAEAKTTIDGLEKERNFYFGKLRQIEILCQTDEDVDAETKAKVLEYLYATDDNDEFEVPEGDEEEDVGAEEAAEEDEDLTF